MLRFHIFCLASALFVSSGFSAFAAPEPFLPPDEVGARQNEFEHRRIQIERLRDSIGEQQYLSEQEREKEQAILVKLEDIDRRLAKRTAKVDDLNNQVKEQEKSLKKIGDELAAVGASKDHAMRHLMRRIRAFYPVGKVGLLGVTFARDNLPEILKFHESFSSLIRYDERALSDYRKKYEQLQAIRESQSLEESVLRDSLEKMRIEQNAVASIKLEQEILLEQVRTQAGLRQRAIQEMQDAASKMTASLRNDIVKERDKANDFRRLKGYLSAPAPGPVITRFGDETTNKMGITKKSQGLVFAASDGQTVRAVAAGMVVFSGYLRGYGNTVIIRHGDDFFTVTARLERLDRGKGDAIKAGDTLGAAGATAMVVDEGFYFELRQGQTAIDPAPWFASGQISFATLPAHQ
jgi:septal ring factor EnvC (AmiA/AmiB activator)